MYSVPYDEPVVGRLLKAAARSDGHPPLSEHKLESVGGPRSSVGAWSNEVGMCVVGVAALHEASGHWAVEIAIAPEQRDPQMEVAAIQAATSLVPDGAPHTIWAFRGDQIEAAERLGYREIRAVLRMTGCIPNELSDAPPRVTIDAMAPGDVGSVVGVNNRAFLGHPEQGAMTEEGFGSLTERAWFDSTGVLIAKVGEQIIGFCITKYEGDGMGEIFAIAVDPEDQHCGIGRALIGAAFDALRLRDSAKVTLWVDASNETAIRFYDSLGLIEDFRVREFAPAS